MSTDEQAVTVSADGTDASSSAAASAASSLAGGRQKGMTSRTKRSRPDASFLSAASASSRPSSESKNQSKIDGNGNSDNKEPIAVVVQTPHTLRLLRLAVSGTSDHSRKARTLLSDLARRSSPDLLWDLLGRLVVGSSGGSSSSGGGGGGNKAEIRSGLYSSKWSERENAAATMGTIAANLPGVDRRGFLSDRHEQEGDDGLWLQVDDLLDSRSNSSNDDSAAKKHDEANNVTDNKLDTILEEGRLLLSSSGDMYSSSNEDDEEDERALRDLDESAVSVAGGDPSKKLEGFLKRRVRLQRQILAKRLGLGGILSAPVVTAGSDKQAQNDMLKEMVDDADLLPSKSEGGDGDCGDNADADPAALARRRNMERRGRKRRRRSTDNKSEQGKNDEEEGRVTLRALLVLEMRRSGSEHGDMKTSSAALSHRNPQTLLATDLLYRTFDADWTVRHGALMAILALMKSWIMGLRQCDGSDDGKAEQSHFFGSWPHDILARCLCILALDRFGDYSGSTLARVSESGGGGDRVVAPVRETAAQLLSLLLSIAPASVQESCCDVLRRLVMHDAAWEVRHGAMLAFKYIVTLKAGVSASMVHGCSCWDNVASLAIGSLSDESDDVRGASAQVLACYFGKGEDDGGDETSPALDSIVEDCATPLWSALLQVGPISSCAIDILELYALVMQYSCDLVLRTVQSKSVNNDAAQATFGSAIQKMIEFLSYDDEAMKLSSLRVVGMIVKPMILRSVSTDGGAEGDRSLLPVADAYCSLLIFMFASYFSIEASEEENAKNEGKSAMLSARDGAWAKAIGAIPPLLGQDVCRAMLSKMLSTIILRFLGIEKTNNSMTPRRVVGSLDTLEERWAASFECQRNAAKALALLVVKLGLIPSEEEDDAITSEALFLVYLLQSLCRSPWSSMCELACTLFAALGEASVSTDKDRPTNNSMVLQCRQLFTSMLLGCPQCLALTAESSWILRDPSVIGACDQILVSMIDYHTSALAKSQSVVSEGGRGKISADGVFQIWQGIFRSKGVTLLQPDATNTKPTTTTISMRLSSSIAGAAISWGLRDLPIKLTPVIRPLMTSLKNEESAQRLDWTSHYLARLLNLRMLEEDNSATPPVPINVRDKVLTNVCFVALADASGTAASSGSTVAGKMILQTIAQDLRGDLNCVAPFSLILSPLKQCSEGGVGSSSALEAIQKGLGLLLLLSLSLQSSSRAYEQIVNNMLQVVVQLACTHPSSRIRGQSVSVVCAVCKSDPVKALQKVVPVLSRHLRSIDNDKDERLNSCRLLQEILDAVGTAICPFVRCLLPITMSLMTDPSEECASLASGSFAALVRVSPLVEKRGEKLAKVQNDGPPTTDNSSDKVIDHLIHGEPLPPLRLSSQIQACLDKSQTVLRGYQQEGISWLHFLQSVNLNGALCDDMGVGKSLQALIGIALAHGNPSAGIEDAKSLVVCPSTVVGHWMNEVTKYFPDEQIFKPLMYTGPAKARKAMLHDQLKGCSLVITSYSVLRNDIDALSSFSWAYCVLDEGHLLKNPRSATAKASRRIKSSHKLILSGTPVQNHVNELWAVFDFLMPNFLGTEAVFTKSFAKPIINGQVSGASPAAIGTSMNKLKLLHQTVLPFILRREKQDVMKELPPKVVTDIPCLLSGEQTTLYRRFIESSEAKHALAAFQRSMQTICQGDDNGASGCGNTAQQELSLGKDVLKSLLYLRLLCTHPMLVVKRDGGPGDNAEDTAEELSRLDCSGKLLALKDLLQSASICSDGLTAADNDQSTLYARRITPDRTDLSRGDLPGADADDLVDGLEAEHCAQGKSKCLLFAQFTQSLDVVEEFLFTPHMPSLRYLRIDGQVPPEERTKRVDRFNSDESIQVMLLTTRVGGLGLNLTGADTVIFLENDWNPFSDLQAMDRAHRIGQTKTVNVYRLICSDTIEEKIMRLQSIKVEMSRAIVNSDNSTMYSMGTDRLLDLFTFEDRQKNNGDRVGDSCSATVEGSTGRPTSHLLDAVSSQEDEYVSLSTESFLRDLLPVSTKKKGTD